MALQAYVDEILTVGGVGSTIVRTGYGFQPKACIYFMSGTLTTGGTNQWNISGDIRAGIGVATSPTDRRAICVQSDVGANTMATDRRHTEAAVMETMSITGVLTWGIDLQSFDSNGQTLVVDVAGAAQQNILCLALGGSDLTNAQTFTLTAPTTTPTTVDFTGLAFQPDALILFTVGLVTGPPLGTNAHQMSIGLVASNAQCAGAWWDQDASGSSDSASYGRTGDCLAMWNSATALNGRAQWVSFLSNGFRLSWPEAPIIDTYFFGLALKGGQYRVGNFTASTTLNATQPQTGFGFQPVGAFFMSHGLAQSTADTPQVGLVASLGAMTSPTNRRAVGWASDDATGTAVLGTGIQHDAVVDLGSGTGAVAKSALVDIQSVESDGFTPIIDDAGPAAEVFYLAFGSAAAAPTGKAPPPRRQPWRYFRRRAA